MRGVDPRAQRQGAINEAEEYIERLVAEVSLHGIECEGVLRFGQPAECIIESARTRRADVIVMATHGRAGPGHWAFGSVAEGHRSRPIG
jgi:nucleotide-binding universal stress UspA family protein